MAKHINPNLGLIPWCLLRGVLDRGLALFVSVLLLSESVAATPGRRSVNIAQQPAATSPASASVATLAKAEEKTPTTSSPTTQSQPSNKPEARVLISQVVVSGVKGKLQEQVYQVIRTKPGRTTTRSQLQEDVNAVYALGYFSNAEFVPEDTPLGVRVTFNVKLNPVLRNVAVTTVPPRKGAGVLPQQVVNHIFAPQYGSILNFRKLQEGIKKLNQWYKDNGYDVAQVIDVPSPTPDGKVTLVVAEGVIEDIQVRFVNKEGKDTDEQGKTIRGETPSSVILQEIQLKPGEVFKGKLAEKDLRRLHDLGIFDDVKLSFTQGKDPRKVILVVNVTENKAASRRQEVAEYQQELQSYKAKKNRVGEANALNKLGNVYNSVEEYQQAIAKYKQALSIYQSRKHRVGEAKVLNNLGNAYKSLKEYQQAIDAYNRALPLFKTLNVPFWQALTLSNIATTYRELDDKDLALDFYNQALLLWRKSEGNPSNTKLRSSKQNVLAALRESSRDRKAKKTNSLLFSFAISTSNGTTFNAGIQLGEDFKKTGYSDIRLWEATTLFNSGGIYQSVGDYQQALYSFKEGLSLWQTLKESQILPPDLENQDKENQIKYTQLIEAFMLLSISQVYSDLGNKKQALNYNNQSLPKISAWLESVLKLAKKEENEGAFISLLLGVFGNFFDNLLTNLASKVDAKQQEELSNQTVGEFFNLIETGFNQILTKPPQDSEQGQVESVKRLFRLFEPSFLISKGDTYAKAGKKQQALDSYKQALLMSQAMNPSQGQKEKNGDALEQATKLFNQSNQAKALKSIGTVLADLGKQQEALDSYNQALPLWQASGNRKEETDTLYLIGKAYSDLNKYREALDYYNRVLSLWRGLGDILKEADTRLGIAVVERSRGNLTQARTEIETAIEMIESERAQTSSTEESKKSTFSKTPSVYKSYIDLASYLASKQHYYEFYIDLLMQLHSAHPTEGYNVLALEVSDRSHARSLRAILNKTNRNIQGEVQAPTRSNPRYVELAKPLPLKEIQQQLDDDTLLLEYSLGEQRSYLWAVTKNSISSYSLPKRADVEAAAQKFYDFLTVPSLRIRAIAAAKAGTDLSQILLEPVANQLGKKRLLLVGDGILNYIPFSALPIPEPTAAVNLANPPTVVKPLLVEHEIVGLPSASTLALLRRNRNESQPPTKILAVLADPVFSREDERLMRKPATTTPTANTEQLYQRLPGTRQEANEILALVPPSLALKKFDFAASRQAALSSELSQYRIVHLATHGILDTQRPEKSGMILSAFNNQGQLHRSLLSTPDAFNLKLSADLVVLSGCRAGLGKQIKGEGIIGLTGGLMYAGARRVVPSLWNVDDLVTAELMTIFYRKMFNEKLSPAAALRAAQIEIWQQTQWKEPYYWAAFVIQGDWK